MSPVFPTFQRWRLDSVGGPEYPIFMVLIILAKRCLNFGLQLWSLERRPTPTHSLPSRITDTHSPFMLRHIVQTTLRV